jgi:hypothetical protein
VEAAVRPSHSEALSSVARGFGYSSWHAFSSVLKNRAAAPSSEHSGRLWKSTFARPAAVRRNLDGFFSLSANLFADSLSSRDWSSMMRSVSEFAIPQDPCESSADARLLLEALLLAFVFDEKPLSWSSLAFRLRLATEAGDYGIIPRLDGLVRAKRRSVRSGDLSASGFASVIEVAAARLASVRMLPVSRRTRAFAKARDLVSGEESVSASSDDRFRFSSVDGVLGAASRILTAAVAGGADEIVFLLGDLECDDVFLRKGDELERLDVSESASDLFDCFSSPDDAGHLGGLASELGVSFSPSREVHSDAFRVKLSPVDAVRVGGVLPTLSDVMRHLASNPGLVVLPSSDRRRIESLFKRSRFLLDELGCEAIFFPDVRSCPEELFKMTSEGRSVVAGFEIFDFAIGRRPLPTSFDGYRVLSELEEVSRSACAERNALTEALRGVVASFGDDDGREIAVLR